MKPILLSALFIMLFLNASAQIFATTTHNRRVLLNPDKTWKYVDEPGGTTGTEKPCLVNYTGNVTFKNNTANDVYVYYAVNTISNVKFSKVKANSSKTVSDLQMYHNGYGSVVIRWAWKATQEMAEGYMSIFEMQGIGEGEFTIVQCDNIEVEID